MSQLDLDLSRKPTGRGGWRPNGGRPKGRTKVAHEAREKFSRHHPIQITLRAQAGLGSLRRERFARVVREAISTGGRLDTFRVVHFNLLSNHLHLICEADSKEALAKGMQGLNVRFARGINRILGRRGAVFAERYHSRAL